MATEEVSPAAAAPNGAAQPTPPPRVEASPNGQPAAAAATLENPTPAPAPVADGERMATWLSTDFGVSRSIGQAAAAWVTELQRAGQAPAGVAKNHRYDFSGHGFTPEDQPYLDAFGNAMAAAGATQDDVQQLLEAHTKIRVEGARQQAEIDRGIDELDLKDVRAAQRTMKQEWGNDYARTLRLVRQHVASLPEERREALEHERLPDGTLALNTPERLRQLAKEALGIGSTSREGELDRLRKLMGNRNSEYWKGPNAERNQARYKALIAGSA